MNRVLVFVVVAQVVLVSPLWAGPPVSPAPIPALAPLRFLLGQWEVSEGGKPGQSPGQFSFELQAGGHAILGRKTSTTPEGQHEDVLLIDCESPNAIHAVYADSEGHVIHFGATVADAKTVMFSSDPNPSVPTFRLSYHLNDDGTLATKFESAGPGSSDFSTHREGTARRK